MEKQIISTGDAPQIRIENVAGDLRLKGHDEAEVVGKTDSAEELVMEAAGDGVNIRCQGDLTLRVPRNASVQIIAALGEADIKGLDGSLEIETVQGDLTLRGVAETQVGKVSGELKAKNVGGSLTLEDVAGDASVRDVQGDFIVSGGIGGNLSVYDVDNDIHARAAGNIKLHIDPAAGQTYILEAGGNVFCRLADEPSVVVDISRAGKIVINLPNVEAPAPQSAPACLTLGDGDANLSISAAGNVVLDSHVQDWSMMGDFDLELEEVDEISHTIDEQIHQQVEAQLRMVQEQMDAQLATLTARLSASGLSVEQARRVEERAREASERASTRAQERMRRAQERMEQKLAAAQRKMEQKTRTVERVEASMNRRGRARIFGMNIPTPPPPPGDPVSEEERLTILRMLEQKKITMEQAEQLLSALEGKGG